MAAELASARVAAFLRVEPARCPHSRTNRARCHACVAVCSTGAIMLCGRPRLARGRCTGCEACTVACPSGALAPAEGVAEHQQQLVAWAANHGEVCFSCARAPHALGAVPLACLAGLDPLLLALATKLGARRIVLVDGDCVKCPCSNSLQAYPDIVTMVKRVAAGFGVPAPVIERRREPHTRGREVACLRVVSKTLACAMAEGASARVAGGFGGPPAMGENGARKELAQMLLPAGPIPLPFVPAGVVARIAECSGCAACTAACPRAALRFYIDGRQARLVFNSRLCHGCGACADACDLGALRVVPELADREEVLAALVAIVCPASRNVFFGSRAACPACGAAGRELA